MESYFFFFHFSALIAAPTAMKGVSSEIQELQNEISMAREALMKAGKRRDALEDDFKKAASQEEKRAIQERVDNACDEVAAFAKSVAELRQDLRDLKSKTLNAPGLSRVGFCCVSPPVWLCC